MLYDHPLHENRASDEAQAAYAAAVYAAAVARKSDTGTATRAP